MKHLERRPASLEEYWRLAVALYIRNKRRGRVQKEITSTSRSTLSLIENAKVNFTLGSLLEALEGVGGDISEAFRSHVPKQLRGEYQVLHEMLQQILDTQDPEAVRAISRDIKNAFAEFVLNKDPGKGH